MDRWTSWNLGSPLKGRLGDQYYCQYYCQYLRFPTLSHVRESLDSLNNQYMYLHTVSIQCWEP